MAAGTIQAKKDNIEAFVKTKWGKDSDVLLSRYFDDSEGVYCYIAELYTPINGWVLRGHAAGGYRAALDNLLKLVLAEPAAEDNNS